jgi:hypothetical protein
MTRLSLTMAGILALLPLRLAQSSVLQIAADHRTIDADGEVSDVTCAGVEMRLKLSAANGAFRLHARDYTRINISEDVPFQAGEFKPCTELSGKSAKITFVTVERKNYDGEIQSIEVDNAPKK